MKIYSKIARCAVFGLALATSAMLLHAQENKDKDKDKRAQKQNSAPAEHHNAGGQPHSAPPVQQSAPEKHNIPSGQNTPSGQHNIPSGQNTPSGQHNIPSGQNTPSGQHNIPSGQQSTPSGQQNSPRSGFGTNQQQQQQQQTNTPMYRNQQQSPGGQPGRTFGNNPPVGNSDSTHGQTQMGGRSGGPAPRTFTTSSGDVIHRDAGGHVQQLRMSNGTTVYHPPDGPRRVEMVRPGGHVVVASSPGHGYMQRNVVVNNTTIIKRTYVYNGVPEARIYRPRVFNGITLAVFTPVHYYRPTFYAYAYNPWARPVVFSWGWNSRPWYGYYGGYFTPYPVYASPSLWLTDFLIAATLETAYQERMAARAASSGGIYQGGAPTAPMTPEVKQAIADEVRRQIDFERAQGQMGGGGQEQNIFGDNVPHVFVVHTSLLVNSNMGECQLSEGDVLQLGGAPAMNSQFGDVIVLSSRGMDCRRGSRASVGLQDLQEMHNQMVATVDRGMGDLQAKQGQGGLPMLPQGSAGTIDTAYAQQAQPDANVASELSSVSQEADRAEQQVMSQGGDAGPPPTLTLGLTIDQVKAIQGEPQKIVDLGSKQIYMYKDLKITFSEGRVSDIQ